VSHGHASRSCCAVHARRMRRDIHVDDAASVVTEHDEHKQHAEGGGGDCEEVDRGQLGDVIGEESTPRL
jgi:hypothetical protein